MSDGWSNRISILCMCCLAELDCRKQKRNCSESRMRCRIESDVDFAGGHLCWLGLECLKSQAHIYSPSSTSLHQQHAFGNESFVSHILLEFE